MVDKELETVIGAPSGGCVPVRRGFPGAAISKGLAALRDITLELSL
jgi:hypothetical protein